MRARTRVLVLIAALQLIGMLGAPSPASAYCDAVFSELTGRCTNGCIEAGRAFTKATGQPAPWDCPM